MTDHRVSDLSYGHLGTAIYDLDEERWLFNRRPGRREALFSSVFGNSPRLTNISAQVMSSNASGPSSSPYKLHRTSLGLDTTKARILAV